MAGERTAVRFLPSRGGPVRIETDQPPGLDLAALERIQGAVQHGEAFVIRLELRRFRELDRRKEGRAGFRFLCPDGMEFLLDMPPGPGKGFPGDLFHGALQVPVRDRAAQDVVVIVHAERRTVIEGPHPAESHEPGRVVIRRLPFEGAVAPLVPVPPVAGVEGDLVIIEEIRGAHPPGSGQRRLRDNGISFKHRHIHIQPHQQAVPHLPRDVLPETQRFPVAELHLGDMPRFMDRQLQRPRRRVGVIRLLYRVQIHPARRPAHGAVGIGITGMEQDGERPPLVLARHHSQARPDHRPVLFQQAEIGPCERIRPLGVDQPVSL